MLVIFGYYKEMFFPCSVIISHMWLNIVLQWSMNNDVVFFCMNLFNLPVFYTYYFTPMRCGY
jgi:hypothetical protein